MTASLGGTDIDMKTKLDQLAEERQQEEANTQAREIIRSVTRHLIGQWLLTINLIDPQILITSNLSVSFIG